MADEETTAPAVEEPTPAPSLYSDAEAVDVVAAEPETAPETAPEPTPEAPKEPENTAEDKQKRAFEDMARREQALLAKERQLSGLTKAQQALASGNHRAAAEALGIDPHRLLADVWGEEMVPAKDAPSVDEQVASVRQALEKTQRDLVNSQAQMARYQLYNKIQGELGSRPELEIAHYLAKSSGEAFFDQVIDYAIEQRKATGQAPDWAAALEFAEKTYEDRYCEIGASVLQLQKIKTRLGHNEPPQAPEKPPAPKPAAPRKTLTSALAAESRTAAVPQTREEKQAAALQALKDGYKRGRELEDSLDPLK